MLNQANTKSVVALLGTGVTAAATVTANIDRLGYDYVSLDLITGTANVVSNTPSVLKITESDDTVATNFTAITALTGGTATGNFTIPNADTSSANVFRLNIDCRARKRYLKLTVSPLTTQQMIMAARLGRAEQVPVTTTAQGTLLSVYA